MQQHIELNGLNLSSKWCRPISHLCHYSMYLPYVAYGFYWSQRCSSQNHDFQ